MRQSQACPGRSVRWIAYRINRHCASNVMEAKSWLLYHA